jgi:peptide deformylase
MKYEIVPTDNKNYQSELEDFNFNEPPIDPVELAKDLHETMNALNGAGMAANQVGLNHRVAVFATEPPLTMYNPKITYYNNEYKVEPEGCLTYPGLYVKIRRPDSIRVRWQDENGEMQAQAFDYPMAKVIQHEVDHLNGIDFVERASKINLDVAKKKWKKLKSKFKKAGMLK